MSLLGSLTRSCRRQQPSIKVVSGLRRPNSTEPSSRRRLAFAFDIDGVLKQGKHVLPHAKRVLAKLTNGLPDIGQIPFLLMTNGGGVTDAERREALSKDLGVPLSEHQLVQSHTPLRDFLSDDWKHQPVLVMGGRGDAARRIAESYGMTRAYILQDLVAWRPSIWDRYRLSEEEKGFVKHIDFSTVRFQGIFVIHDDGLDWALAIQVITELLCSKDGVLGTRRPRVREKPDGLDIPLILTNPDVIWSTDYPLPRLGMGAFRLALDRVFKHKTGRRLSHTRLGKPYKPTYEFAEKMLRQHVVSLGGRFDEPLNVYMVGDNPTSDIAGANLHGWSSLLVRTGVWQGTPFPTGSMLPCRPTATAGNVEQAVGWAIKRVRKGIE